ncbi:hypothetical protein C8Q75DRAFT_790033 [Abortiporus biennis]|nr:hypothetical protein C8Q75DRAFT_790033 [Abortiporus biennis]
MSTQTCRSAVLFPPPPPTSHIIDERQRTRLVRSTKKLGSILGTTPQIAEVEVATTLIPVTLSSESRKSTDSNKPLKRQGSVFSSSTTSYLSSSSSVRSFSEARKIYSTPSLNSSISSLAFVDNNNNNTSSTIPSNELQMNSHTLPKSHQQKGRRTFDVPRPLVLHLTAPPPHLTVRSHSPLPTTPSSSGTLTPSSSTSTTPSATITPITPIFPSPTETRRKRMAKLTRTLGEKIPPQLVFGRKPSIPSFKTSYAVESAYPNENNRPVPVPGNRRRSMSVDLSVVASVASTSTNDSTGSFSRSSRVWTTGNASWRGEWNRKDIKDVQKQLRNLKAR